MNRACRIAALALLLAVDATTAAASGVLHITLENVVRDSLQIEVGRVRRVDVKETRCHRQVTVDYDVERTMKGRKRPRGKWTEALPMFGTGCMSVHITRYPCRVQWNDAMVGKPAIFFLGAPHGSACDVITRITDVERALKERAP